jgi:GNAT superfamily N-acetyltransferase
VISYKQNADLDVSQVIDLYIRSTLGERRPIDQPKAFEAMIKHANLIITAWEGDKLIGISRTFTDFAYVAYLADLAVDQVYQRQGIGKQLIKETQNALDKNCMIVLLAAPKAKEYYKHIGFEHHPRAWTIKKTN